MMKFQKGSAVAWLLSAVAFIGAIILIVVASYISANNYGATVEAQLRAARDDNKNVLAQYQQKVLEAAQVPSMYKDDLKEVVAAAVTGRYGADGSKAVMQWIKEANIQFDSQLYVKLQEIIQSGRKDFEIGQTRMIDIRRGYEVQQGLFWRGMWLRMAGFPKVNMADFNPITTDGVEDTYRKGKESAPLKLR